MKVTFYQRKPHKFHYSIEMIFEGIRKNLPDSVIPRIAISKYESKGLFKRIYNTVEAIFRQDDINHITGDVHFLSILLKKNKTILTIHDCGFMNNTSSIQRWVLQFFWLWLPARRCKIITTISTATKNDIIKYTNCDPDKIIVVPDFISSNFQPVQKEFNQQKPNLLLVGTKHNKNIPNILKAIEGINCTVSIVGENKEHIRKVLNELNIDFNWYHNLSEEEIIERYIKCDMLVFASTLEGFGMPIIEAQTVGRPVITSNISSMPEVAGDGAHFVNPYDINSIREGVLKVISDDVYRHSLILKGKKNIKRFSQKEIANKYFKVYNLIYVN